MLIVVLSCLLMIASVTVVHYETLSTLSSCLPRLAVPNRIKVLVVFFVVFFAHVLEIVLYGIGFFALSSALGLGSFDGHARATLSNCLYFSAETYSSLGFGDLTPSGPMRILAGVEALNGLLLIGWSASYLYLVMERFWTRSDSDPKQR